jgi:lipopolysaccharide transport system ATP-binding protein
MPTLQGQGLISLRLDRLDLVGGRYFLDVGVYEQNWEYAYDYHWHVYAFTVDSPPGQKGIITPPHSWHFDE